MLGVYGNDDDASGQFVLSIAAAGCVRRAIRVEYCCCWCQAICWAYMTMMIDAVAPVFFVDLNCLQYRTIEIVHDTVLVAFVLYGGDCLRFVRLACSAVP